MNLPSGVEIGLSSTVYTFNEIDGNATLFEICARLNAGTLERDVTVNLISRDGSATSTGMAMWIKFVVSATITSFFYNTALGQDFQSVDTQLTFTSGQTTGGMQCTDLQILDDNILESEETLTLHLVSNDTSVVVITTNAESAVVTIEEDPTDGNYGNP